MSWFDLSCHLIQISEKVSKQRVNLYVGNISFFKRLTTELKWTVNTPVAILTSSNLSIAGQLSGNTADTEHLLFKDRKGLPITYLTTTLAVFHWASHSCSLCPFWGHFKHNTRIRNYIDVTCRVVKCHGFCRYIHVTVFISECWFHRFLRVKVLITLATGLSDFFLPQNRGVLILTVELRCKLAQQATCYGACSKNQNILG